MQCPDEEIIAKFFYNVSSSFQLFLIFSYFTSILLAKLFYFLGGNPFFWRNRENGYEFAEFSDEENEYYHNDAETGQENHFVTETFRESETLVFMPNGNAQENQIFSYAKQSPKQSCGTDEGDSVYGSPASKSVHSDHDEEEILNSDSYNCDSQTNGINHGKCYREMKKHKKVKKSNKLLCREENFLVYAPSKLESKKIFQFQKNEDIDEIYGDSYTVDSTSKSSSEYRNSIKDSEDPFSSSSRRSCPKWESYTIFQKYDEEMLFLDRISTQKLHETESLRSIQSCPRSISDRIVYKLATKNRKSSDFRQNPYHELEAAYVAQVCLAWEALSWNYKYFKSLRASREEEDPGCPAYIAQQFQQFQVLLQRYVENEPYEHGKRPEIYARMRSLAPKLLQVPEYRDSDEEKGQENFCSRISSNSFLRIMEEAIRTFMNFLKADKKNRCQVLVAALFRKNKRGSADPTLLLLLKKVNKKKKSRVKDLRRSGKCSLGKRKLKEEEEMEILMGLIDLKVVSRVLRMSELNDEQLHWCEDKMSKVRVSDAKLYRDSSPLFFPAHTS
ncbi:uncharacterized protein LOC107780088 [Nicotiana tabacum]|uniref:Uncharacterized protein LOC107780088 n=1 Tax=Nicotiana tabacum TaxID=4097 RepID=A0A1S3YVQ0_TOBAC|nr:PREDICTED: uncharacterized protein LOC107780088 [Nicotiana tabacum]